MIELLEKEFPNLNKYIKTPLNPRICKYLQMFVNDKNLLASSLIQNPFGINEDLEKIENTFGSQVSNYLKELNALQSLNESIIEQYDEHKAIIILFLVNHKFIFEGQTECKGIDATLTPKRIEYAMKLLEQMDVSEIRSELEDHFFNFLEPETYNHYIQLLKFTRENYKNRENEIKNKIASTIKEAGINADIQSRLKSIFSVHKKKKKKKILYSQVLDTIGIRIIVDDEKGCYQVMGLILRNYTVISNKVKDYIVVPKGNGYQSIHLTIIEGQQPVEIQIRTRNMHHYAQYGLAAHHQYKAEE